jgi:16S rRNA processing protein RimM
LKENVFFPIGKIVGVHGIRGYLKVLPYTESLSVFRPGGSIWLKHPGGRESVYVTEGIRPHKRLILLSLKGINDRNQSESLVHAEIFIEKGSLPELEEGVYYWADLIGLSVFASDETYMGRIESVIPTGSNDVYVVKDTDRETLIPALESVVVAVDLEKKIMRVDLPEGL